MINNQVLTKTEQKIIEKKLNNKKLTKQDSYYLAKSIRPKLKQMEELVKRNTLKRIEYNQKAKHIENKIKHIVLEELENTKAIVLCGSAIQTNYSNYKDIDAIIITKNSHWENQLDKLNTMKRIESKVREQNLNLDIQIIDSKTFQAIYPSNISLVYQLETSKIIYGKIKLPKKIEISKLDLNMKMDWSELSSSKASGDEIYNCIRNTLLIKLILNKIIDNFYLSNYLIEELGKNLITKLKENIASATEKNLSIHYLNKINEETSIKIDEGKWEKIVI